MIKKERGIILPYVLLIITVLLMFSTVFFSLIISRQSNDIRSKNTKIASQFATSVVESYVTHLYNNCTIDTNCRPLNHFKDFGVGVYDKNQPSNKKFSKIILSDDTKLSWSMFFSDAINNDGSIKKDYYDVTIEVIAGDKNLINKKDDTEEEKNAVIKRITYEIQAEKGILKLNPLLDRFSDVSDVNGVIEAIDVGGEAKYDELFNYLIKYTENLGYDATVNSISSLSNTLHSFLGNQSKDLYVIKYVHTCTSNPCGKITINNTIFNDKSTRFIVYMTGKYNNIEIPINIYFANKGEWTMNGMLFVNEAVEVTKNKQIDINNIVSSQFYSADPGAKQTGIIAGKLYSGGGGNSTTPKNPPIEVIEDGLYTITETYTWGHVRK